MIYVFLYFAIACPLACIIGNCLRVTMAEPDPFDGLEGRDL